MPLQRWGDYVAGCVRLARSLRGGPGHAGARSDHFDGEHFFNPGAGAGKSLADVWRWQRTRVPRPWPPWREYRTVAQLPRSISADEIAVTFINHVTFLLQLPGVTLLTDPVYSMRASPVQWIGPRRVHAPGLPFEQLPHIDAVFVSHNHYDHLDAPTLRRLDRMHAPLFVSGLGNAAFLRGQGLGRVVELDWWQRLPVGEALLTFTPAQHWSTRGPGSANRTLWGGMWLTVGERSLYFAGDTGYAPLFTELRRRCGSPELALLPIGAYEPRWFMREQHMNPEEAVRAHLDLGARESIGCHFGCFRLTDEGIDEPLTELEQARRAHDVAASDFHVLQPGQTRIWRAGARGLHVVA
ncbi:MAG TPA: MBL fold metallo-hydrolase [Steroidobacteraceae bacterium]|nr:MBL fold metallo-hydrolase [Steroidobacteraceae bacterium]